MQQYIGQAGIIYAANRATSYVGSDITATKSWEYTATSGRCIRKQVDVGVNQANGATTRTVISSEMNRGWHSL